MSLLNLPGLSLGTGIGLSVSAGKHDVTLDPGSEWRFEIPFKSKYTIKLIRGTAEIFGTEIALGQEYTFSGYKGVVYTWQGCLIEYGPADENETTGGSSGSGGQINEYTSEETPMNFYLNLHFGLERMRGPLIIPGTTSATPSATTPPSTAPRILVIGPKDCGKSSLCKLLVAYANKCGRFPMLVNTDPAESAYAVPGALTATVVSDILDVEQGWGSSAITGPVLLHTKQPLAFLYGLEHIHTNLKYYTHVVSRLALAVNARLQDDALVRSSGVVIDTPSDLITSDKDQTHQQGYSAIASMIADFEINVLLVVGQERLYSEMLKRFGKPAAHAGGSVRPPPTVIKVPRSGGCVDREPAYRRAVQAALINEYFYGSPKQPLSPYTVTVDYSTLCIYRVAEEKTLHNASVLPIGLDSPASTSNSSLGPLSSEGSNSNTSGGSSGSPNSSWLIKLEPSSIVQNCVMAMLNANVDDPIEKLCQAEVLGFVHVVEADDNRHNMRVRMPVHGQLPKRPFVIGEFRYHE